jgi:DNA repair exonuclease SbcCD ATPase subunit
MIQFISITMRNFMSYGNNITTILLDRPGTTLIVGEDLDNTTDGKGANGVGKTTLVNAIVYALYGKPVSKISMDNLINNVNKKNMEVIVEFKIRDNHYMIKRYRKTKDGSGVYLIINGEDKTPDSIANTDAEIERILGMPYELFVRIVVFSASHEPFLDMPVRHVSQANQSDFIEELFGLVALSQKAELLKLVIKDTERDATAEKSRLSIIEQEHARYATQVDSAKRRAITWEVTNTNSINALELKLEQLKQVDIPQQQSLLNTLEEVDSQLSSLINEQRSADRDKRDADKLLTSKQSELSHLDNSKCPYCLQDFVATKAKIKLIRGEITQLSEKLQELGGVSARIAESIAQLSHKHKEIKAQITVDNIEELIEINSQSGNITQRIQELRDAVNPLLDPLDELASSPPPAVDYQRANELERQADHEKFLLKLLTRKDSFVRKELLGRNIPYLNAQLQHHLTFLGLPHKVEFTHEMTAAISQFGNPLDFGNLSAGQRARVNFALSLAFRDVLQQLHQKVNICMFDEVLDVGLDAVGTAAAAKLLRHIASKDGVSVYIVSHKSEFEGLFDTTMTVQLSQGFSYIKET